MLKIQRTANGEVVLTLSGRMDGENVTELQGVFASESQGRRIVLDLSQVSRAVRRARNQVQELPRLHPRVDHAATKREFMMRANSVPLATYFAATPSREFLLTIKASLRISCAHWDEQLPRVMSCNSHDVPANSCKANCPRVSNV
jgi:hypothetical protein